MQLNEYREKNTRVHLHYVDSKELASRGALQQQPKLATVTHSQTFTINLVSKTQSCWSCIISVSPTTPSSAQVLSHISLIATLIIQQQEKFFMYSFTKRIPPTAHLRKYCPQENSRLQPVAPRRTNVRPTAHSSTRFNQSLSHSEPSDRWDCSPKVR